MRCQVYVVAVPGVGPFVPINASFFDVVIGFDDFQRHIWRLTRTWRAQRDCWAHFSNSFSVVSFHEALIEISYRSFAFIRIWTTRTGLHITHQ